MRRGHVQELLAAYLDGELLPVERREVEEHLPGCRRCREALGRVRRGAELARELDVESLPAEAEERTWSAIREAIRAEEAREGSRTFRRRTARWAAAAAAAAVSIAVLAWWSSPRVEVERAQGPPTRLEEVALTARAERLEGAPLNFVTGSPEEARRWLEARGLSAALAVDRPRAERREIALEGAVDVSRPGLRAAAVSYRIDGHPVLLIAAREEAVPDAPRWGLFGKRVLYRRDGGAKLLTWTNGGKAYTLISDLPELGQRACLICHTDAERRRLVRRLGDEAGV